MRTAGFNQPLIMFNILIAATLGWIIAIQFLSERETTTNDVLPLNEYLTGYNDYLELLLLTDDDDDFINHCDDGE